MESHDSSLMKALEAALYEPFPQAHSAKLQKFSEI